MKVVLLLLTTVVVLCQSKPDKLTDLEEEIEGLINRLDHEEKMAKFDTRKPLDTLWETFKAEFGKKYSSTREETQRKETFANHLEEIQEHNLRFEKGLTSFTLGVNQLSDMSLSEVMAKRTGYKKSNRQSTGYSPSIGSTYLPPSIDVSSALPATLDWRKQGYVTPVKDQGQCGACWAFSTVGSIEGQNFKATGKLVSLSEQFLVDCCGAEGENGCNGGLEEYGFQCVYDQGIASEKCYKFTAKDKGTCNPHNCPSVTNVTGFFELAFIPPSEAILKQALALVGPISIAVDASHDSFQSYAGGVYDEPQCSSHPDSLDHAMLLVGYGSLNKKDIWIVKNSWNTDWGDKGYIYFARNQNNRCGIASNANYPLV